MTSILSYDQLLELRKKKQALLKQFTDEHQEIFAIYNELAADVEKINRRMNAEYAASNAGSYTEYKREYAAKPTPYKQRA